jgi:hypothetical protein
MGQYTHCSSKIVVAILRMSAFGGKADMTFALRYVRFWPKADIAMPRIVQYASDCTALLSQALGKFGHSVMIPID